MLLPVLRTLGRLALLALCLQSGAASAAPTSDLRFKRLEALNTEDVAILSLLQERQGFMWIGTYAGGLYRYNGYQAQRYTNVPQQPRSLPHDRVSALYQDRRGRLWIGTQDGLALYHPASDDFTRYVPHDGPTNHRIIKAIIGDGKDGLWLATWGGVQHFDPERAAFTQYVHDPAEPDSLATNDINAIALDAQGGLWAGTWPGGLDYLEAGTRKFRHFRVDQPAHPDPKLNIVRALLIDDAHTMWLGTESGIVQWPMGSDWASRRRIDSPDSRVNFLTVDSARHIWAATQSAGLLRWAPGKAQPTLYQHRANDPHSLQSDNIRAVLQDKGGMLWVASFTDGISLANVNSRGLRRFLPHDPDRQNRQPNNALLTLAGAPGARMWLAGNTGLSLFDPASGAVLRSWQGAPQQTGALSSSSIYSLYQQPGGPLWVGTASGLNRLEREDGPFSTIHLGQGAADFINAIAPGDGDTLWLGTGNSVMRYHSASGRHETLLHQADQPNSRSVDGTSIILQDRQGRVWMGSEWNGGGLDMYQPQQQRFTNFTHSADPHSIASDNVATLFEDRRGRLWVGSARGLQEIRSAADGTISFHPAGPRDQLGPQKVLAILDDAAGMLWLSTAAGLVRLDPASGAVSRYNAGDGTSDGFTTNAVHAGADGTLYFGGVRGMTGVTPAQVARVSVTPPVALTDISVFNHSLKGSAKLPGVELQGAVTAPTSLTLALQESVFSIEFSALHYVDPAQNSYAYRLAGFDRDWVRTDSAHRSATYTNLDPGHYLFEVKAANEHGQWSDKPATLAITILPPFWQTWWFRLLCMAATLALMTWAYRLRVRRLTRNQAKLEALVVARTRELEASNDKLAALSMTDAMTGITNRRGFDIMLEREWPRARREGRSISLAMIDVDFFKNYNDHYGHPAGDECLRVVATVIGLHARRTSDVAARYGGEEFALLAPGTDLNHALRLAQTICDAVLQQDMAHQKSDFGKVSVSVGVASLVPGEADSPEQLVRLADQALYRAKQQGRNRVCQ